MLFPSKAFVSHPPAVAAAFSATRVRSRAPLLSVSSLSITSPSTSTSTLRTPVNYSRVSCFSSRTSLASTTTSTTTSAIPMEKISTQGSAPPAAPYSQGIKAAGLIFVSGQIPADENGKLVDGSIAEVTRQCCKNVEAILKAGGSSIDKVVRVGVFLADMQYFAEMNKEYEQWFTHKPARACVAVKELPKSVKVEIEAIALA